MPQVRQSDEIKKEIADLRDQLTLCRAELTVAHRREGKRMGRKPGIPNKPKEQGVAVQNSPNL